MRRLKIQYISDIHADTQKIMPIIKPLAKYLAVCGDIGHPEHPRFYQFLQQQSKNFEKVIFVPGNHDFDLGPMYNKQRVDKYEPVVKNMCKDLGNVHYLNKNTLQLDDDFLIAGSILWSMPIFNKPNDLNDPKVQNYLNHIKEHSEHVNWMQDTINRNLHKKIIMLTHFVPTFKLIEQKYKDRGIHSTCWFATNLEYMIKFPVRAWICGHTHSEYETTVNDVPCVVNAYGYSSEVVGANREINKIIYI